MSKEIEDNTRKFFREKDDSLVTAHCYLNTSMGQYLWLQEEIKETERVTHLVRIKAMDMGTYVQPGDERG